MTEQKHPTQSPDKHADIAQMLSEFFGPTTAYDSTFEARLAEAARLKCQVTRTLTEPTHVRITWDDVPVAVGYIEGPRAPAPAPADAQPAREPVEDRLRALAADMDTDQPLTAEILRQFADEVTHLPAAGDRAIQSIVSRLPDGTYPTTPDGK